MKRFFIFFFALCVLLPWRVFAYDIIFDSTTAADKGSGNAWRWTSSGGVGCSEGTGHELWLEFDFTTTSQVEIAQIVAQTWTLATGQEFCLSWTNGVSDEGFACTTTYMTGNSTSTIDFPVGNRPWVFPYGSAVTFSAASSSVDIDYSLNTISKDETGYSVIDNVFLNCDAGGSYLPTSTYGIPSMQILGSSVEPFPPLVDYYGLTGTTTAMTQDFGFFGNYFRDVLIWLFTPSEDIINIYNQKKSELSLKVPWGWWSQLEAGFGSVSSTQTPTTTALTMDIPHGGVTTTVAIFDIDAVTKKIPESVLILLRSLGAIAMWALFGTWIWVIVTGRTPDDDV